MEERYRLVFRGEVLDGQHPAVVKKKLGQALGITDKAKLKHLFAGKPVVIRKDSDTKTAAKFQAAFKSAGARLRVLPVVLTAEELEAQEAERARLAEAEALARARAEAPDEADFADSSNWAVMPHGVPVLNDEEREDVPAADIDTDHIRLDTAASFLPEDDDSNEQAPAPEIAAPDFGVAEPGAQIGPPAEEPLPLMDVDEGGDFSIAEPGVELVEPSEPVPSPVLDSDIDFGVADPGADFSESVERPVNPPMPDTSHLTLESEPESESATSGA